MKNFKDVSLGDSIGPIEFGPLSIEDTVRWAGVQENSERVHWDREFAREHSRLPTFIASGAYRQALLARVLTDWAGAGGRLVSLRVRHVAPTFEGDMICYQAEVVEKSNDPKEPRVTCEIVGKNQSGLRILLGRCTLTLSA